MKKSNNPQSKNFRIILVTLFFISFNPYYLSSQWIQQHVPENSGIMISMDFADNGTGMFGGWQSENDVKGRLYISTSNGTNWNPAVFPDSVRAVTGIQMINENTGFICGAYNLSETDFIPDKLSLSKEFNTGSLMSQLNHKAGMTGTENYKAIFLKSENGGDSWENFANLNPEYDYLTAMSFLNKDTGVAVASIQENFIFISRIIKTVNGGLDWSELNIPANVKDITSIIYSDKNVIIAAGSSHQLNGIIISSYDGGKSWAETTFNAVSFFNEINFTDPSTCFATAFVNSSYPVSQIYKTTNSGYKWDALNTRFDSIHITKSVFDIEKGNVYIFGNRTIQSNQLWILTELIIGKSTDNCQSWQITEYPEYESIFCSGISDSSEIFAGGGHREINMVGYLLHSTNGGTISLNNAFQEVPADYKLYQNYPNPFNPSTIIKFDVNGRSNNESYNVKLTIHNYLGKVLKTITDKKFGSGSHEVTFDGNDFPSGIYFYTINTGNYTETKKMILLR